MLGLGGFFITRYMDAGIDVEATKYFNEHKLKNFELISSLGITDDDLAQIKDVDGVTDAEGVFRVDGSLQMGGLKRNVEIISVTERISVPEVVDGTAPSAKDECMIGEDFAYLSGLKIGDKVRLAMPEMPGSENNSAEEVDLGTGEDSDEEAEDAEQETAKEDKNKVLLCDEFTVTGLMRHPDYMRRKSVNTVVLPWSAYDKEVTDGVYTHVFVLSEEPEGVDIFKDKYFKETAGIKKTLEELTDVLAVDSAKRAKNKAYAKIDREWQKALADLNEAQEKIDDNEATLNDELADARKELEDAQNELDSKVADANKKISAGEKKLRSAESKIKAGEKKLNDAKKALKLIEENLPDAKKLIKELREKYNGDLDEALSTLNMAKGILDKLKGLNPDSEAFRNTAKELADFILEHKDLVMKVKTFFGQAEVAEIAEKLKDVTGIDATGTVNALKNFDADALFSLAENVQKTGGNIGDFVKKTQELVDSITDTLAMLDEYDGYIEKFEKNRSKLYGQIADKEKELAAAKKELAAGKKKLAELKAQLAAEKSKYQAEIQNGWSMYYSKKADYESKLEEAKALLAENREAAEAKLEEAKAEVEKIECKWLVLDRRANAGYVDMKSNIAAVESAGLAFGLLFILISAIVCFSTLSIIIEEQKKMVGTVKAFGFHKGEILGKYLMFGITAAVIGCIAGILIALGLSGFVLQKYHGSGMYQFDCPASVVTPGPTVAACACMIIVCALATVIACMDILRSPASILMKGGRAKKASKKKSSSGKGGSLYSRLIIRNMLEDKVRVLISIAIIAFSTMLIGTGISMKLAYDGMRQKQLSDVFKYDIRVDLGDKVTEEQKADLARTLTADGADYTLASYETHLYRWDDKLDALNVLTGDPDTLGDFFAVTDSKTGEALALPDDGVLVQKKMMESYDMTAGKAIPTMNSELDLKDATIKGYFQNYVGRIMVTSPEGYRATFGEDPVYNCYYVKGNGADIAKIESDLLSVTEDVSFAEAKEFASKFEAVSFLYNIIVYLSTGIAILMSFMILTNLANIFLNRKKTELTVMRINGFSIKQTRGYLAKETVVTTVIGIVLGVLLGAVGAPVIIRMVEQPDLQFIRSFHPVAWIAAVVLVGLFSIIINSLVFRKVRNLNLRDVA